MRHVFAESSIQTISFCNLILVKNSYLKARTGSAHKFYSFLKKEVLFLNMTLQKMDCIISAAATSVASRSHSEGLRENVRVSEAISASSNNACEWRVN